MSTLQQQKATTQQSKIAASIALLPIDAQQDATQIATDLRGNVVFRPLPACPDHALVIVGRSKIDPARDPFADHEGQFYGCKAGDMLFLYSHDNATQATIFYARESEVSFYDEITAQAYAGTEHDMKNRCRAAKSGLDASQVGSVWEPRNSQRIVLVARADATAGHPALRAYYARIAPLPPQGKGGAAAPPAASSPSPSLGSATGKKGKK